MVKPLEGSALQGEFEDVLRRLQGLPLPFRAKAEAGQVVDGLDLLSAAAVLARRQAEVHGALPAHEDLDPTVANLAGQLVAQPLDRFRGDEAEDPRRRLLLEDGADHPPPQKRGKARDQVASTHGAPRRGDWGSVPRIASLDALPKRIDLAGEVVEVAVVVDDEGGAAPLLLQGKL